MTPDLQTAHSIRYSSDLVWHFSEIQPGLFAVFDYHREPILFTRDWEEVLAAYRRRAPYVSKRKLELEARPSIDIGKLEIRI